MAKPRTRATGNTGRPDTWVESLSVAAKSGEPLDELTATLGRLAEAFGVWSPAVLVGHRTGREAVAQLRHTIGHPLADLYGFALAGDAVGDDEVRFPTAADWRKHDGVLCLDADPNAYLNAVQFCYSEGLKIPVLTDFDSLPGQFCQMSVRLGETRSDHYIYNYFTKLYRLKDPLQLVWRVHWTDGSVSRGTRILGPNHNIHLSAEELDPPDGEAAGTLVYEARNPVFARVPNSRFRGVTDLLAPSSCATLHGDEIEPKRLDEGQWFDTHVGLLGGGHDIIIGVRNDLLRPGTVTLRVDATPVGGGGLSHGAVTLAPDETEKEVSVEALLGAGNEPIQTRIVARVEGRSSRLEMSEVRPNAAGPRRFLRNHGSTNGISMLRLVEEGAQPDPADESLHGQLSRLAARNVLPLPYPLPVFPAQDRFEVDFSAGKFLPRIESVIAAAFDREGRLLGRETVQLPKDLGYIGAARTPFADALAARGGMLLISPPYVEKHLVTYQNCREDLWIRLTDRESGDCDFAEFQLHNRNLRGYTVPIGFGQTPQMIKARTEMMIRFRRDGDFETRLMLINASPELDFGRTGEVELEFNHPDGHAAAARLSLAPQTWRFVDLSAELPDIVRDSEFGWVRVLSDNVALSAYAALIDRRAGRVGFQHLWGA